jgi:hypothetical protein
MSRVLQSAVHSASCKFTPGGWAGAGVPPSKRLFACSVLRDSVIFAFGLLCEWLIRRREARKR